MKRFTPRFLWLMILNAWIGYPCFFHFALWAEDHALLVQYPIKEAVGPWPLAANYTLPGINAKRLMLSEALSMNLPDRKETLNRMKGKSGNYWVEGWPESYSLDLNRYIHFSISPQVGYEMTLSFIRFTLYSSVSDKNIMTGPVVWELHALLEDPISESQSASGWRETFLKGMAAVLGAQKDSKTLLHTQKLSSYSKSVVPVEVMIHDNRLLTNVRPGSTVFFRLYGYMARPNGQGGLWHIGQEGTDIMVYGSLKPMKSCRIYDLPISPMLTQQKMNFYLVDGTWGHESGGRDFESPSHVGKLIHLLKGEGVGNIFYFRGPGNEKDSAMAGQYTKGAFGSGSLEIAEHVYQELVKNYNNGHTQMSFIGWSRGSAIVMQVLNYIYYRGIPNKRKGGYYIAPNTDCLNIDQVHFLDMVHSMGVPGNDINHGWYDKALPPNIAHAWHYLADTENYHFGFKQTRPSSAIELPMCRNMGILPSHGDIGGSSRSPCSKIVLDHLIERINGGNQTYVVDDDFAIMSQGYYNQRMVSIYSTLGALVKSYIDNDEEHVFDPF